MTTLQIRNDAMVELLRADFYSREDHVVLSDDMWIELDERPAVPTLPPPARIRIFARNVGVNTSQLCFIDRGGNVVCSGGGVAAPHNILSATHTDAAVQAVSRGSLIYGDATPDWNELVIGPQYAHLESDGVDVAWQANLTMADDTYIGLGAAAGRLVFDSTPAPDQVEVTAADLNFVTTGHGIIHVDGVSAGPPRQLLIANGTRYVPGTLAATDLAAHNLLSAQHGDTNPQIVSRGSLIYGNAIPDWDELTHPGGAGYALVSLALDLAWDQTPAWTGQHMFGAGWLLSGGVADLDGIADALVLDGDGDTTISAPTDDQIDIEIAGADDFTFTANAFNVLGGSDIVMADDSWIGAAANDVRIEFDSTDGDVMVGLGDAAGSDEFQVLDNASVVQFRVDSSARVFINESSNADMTIGLTINQDANDDEAFALKSSDVAHGMTNEAETDTYFFIQKRVGDTGGAELVALTDQAGTNVAGALNLVGYAGIPVIGKGATSNACVEIWGGKGGAASAVAVAANENLLAIRNLNTTCVIFEGDGGMHFIPGSDIDHTFLTIQVTGLPNMMWDESEDAFSFNRGLITTTTLGEGLDATSTTGIGVEANSSTGTALVANLTGAGTAILDCQDNGTTAFIVDDGGNVGVGNIAAPLTQLHVYHATNDVILRVETDKVGGFAVTSYHNDAREWSAGIGANDQYRIRDGTAPATRLAITLTGHVIPGANKTQDLGLTGTRWRTLYQGTSTAAGTSRVFESTRDCPLCLTRMVRGTGSLCILGEDRDYEVAHCPDCGVMAVEEMKHLPSARLAERRPPPKIEFLGLDVFPMSGNSRKVQVCFRYGEGEDEVLNSTFLGETELADLMAMDEATRRTFLLELGRREWEALEELRIQEKEVATLQGTLDELVGEFVGVDLLQ